VVSCIGNSGVGAQRLCGQSSEIARRDKIIAVRCGGHVSGDSYLADSDIGGPKGNPFSFASGEEARRL
jgi:hypothetical protein